MFRKEDNSKEEEKDENRLINQSQEAGNILSA